LLTLLLLAWAAATPSETAAEIDANASALRPALERYAADEAVLKRKYPEILGPERRERMRAFYTEWAARIEKIPFTNLNAEGRIDWVLFHNQLGKELRSLTLADQAEAATTAFVPFRHAIRTLESSRAKMLVVDPEKSAATLHALARQVKALDRSKPSNQASAEVELLRAALKRWFNYYIGYDPLFTWWAAEPYKAADSELAKYAEALKQKEGGGIRVGRERLLSELQAEMIPYTPEELVALANKEFAWCTDEMKKASREMGFGDNWRQALEKVKTLHVPPGQQPEMIRRLAREAEEWVESRGLVSVPPLAKEVWRMEMMTPERQLINPFFTGGEVISVSYPTAEMTQEQKLMSMRGNNEHFARATVHHELIPGHHLQMFMNQRYRTWRRPFSTPFSLEGWALYWELVLWDKGFARSPEDRVGMLFWHMHRCARIIFSLSFHLGTMTQKECVDMLVERVGHERDNAEAEVRRSFESPSYGPLYQAAYLLGGLQLRSLRRELVDTGKMTERDFHDRILRENQIPVEMMRAALRGDIVEKSFQTSWKFYE
jgi:hypothetical protein